MFALDHKITLNIETLEAANLCDRFEAGDLVKIGELVYTGYEADRHSRYKWERRTQAAMDLAMQVQKSKTFPWVGASNVAFPLITIGALQFHSRAYPALISGIDVVKCRVIGDDPDSSKKARANRISTHMSWQVLEQDASWEEQKDRLLINLPIVGSVFVKSYWSADKGYKVAETVLAQDFVLDYWAKSVEACPRKTHVVPFFRNDLHSRIKRGMFRNVSEEAWYSQPSAPQEQSAQDTKRDNRLGQQPPSPDETTPYICLEQHLDLDLDGDGYAEPYIITIEGSSKAVLRIVAGFDREEDIERNKQGEIISIRRQEYFTKYEFIPSPDGGIMGVGFGVLLGPLNESTNTLINQLIDAGTWAVTAGGFLGRGAKVRGGVYTFAPLEWKRVDSSGDDLRKNIVPHEVREPSAVLFQLLSLLINYVNRVAGTTDPMVGENPGQNTPAETMRTMVQEGQRIYSGVFKRVWRCMKEEFKKGYVLNGLYLPVRQRFGKSQLALREDYLGSPDEVVPAADPNISSDSMQVTQAQLLKAAAASTPGYDLEEVERRYLKAIKIDAIDQVYPGIKKTGMPKDTKLQIAEMKSQVEMAWLEADKMRFVLELQEESRMNNAEISKIAAEIENMRASTEGDAADRQIGLMNAILGSLKTRNDVLMKRMDVMIKGLELRREKTTDTGYVRRLERTPSNTSGASSASLSARGA